MTLSISFIVWIGPFILIFYCLYEQVDYETGTTATMRFLSTADAKRFMDHVIANGFKINENAVTARLLTGTRTFSQIYRHLYLFC